ncbi:MAG: hypothetical protein M3Q98_08460 [Actinomycetota bacterium]|nr:hypothetical protein [Actinomycetota bacterium]
MSYPSYPPGNEPPPPPGATYGYGAPGLQGPQANQMALWSMITGIAFAVLYVIGIFVMGFAGSLSGY